MDNPYSSAPPEYLQAIDFRLMPLWQQMIGSEFLENQENLDLFTQCLRVAWDMGYRQSYRESQAGKPLSLFTEHGYSNQEAS